MRTSEEIVAEIEDKFGFFPPFFSPALENPQVLENLWQQTLSAYACSPLPAVFKEKLSAYLSRFCAVPYCMICHSCALRPLGAKGGEILALLAAPPPVAADIDKHLEKLRELAAGAVKWPESNSELEDSLLGCAIVMAAGAEGAEGCRAELRRLLGSANYQHLVAFVAYVKTCHLWMEAHPEIAPEADRRVREHLGALFKEEPGLAEFFGNYRDRVAQERQSGEERLAAARSHEQLPQWQLADCFENASSGLHWLDAEGRILWANQAELEMLGYAREDYIGRHIAEFHADARVSDDMLVRLRDRETLHNFEARLRCKDGSFADVAIDANVVWEKGKFVRARCFTRDITEKKRAQRLLAGQKKVLEAIASGASFPDILDTLARTIEEQSPGMLCSILLLDADGKKLRQGAAPSLPDPYFWGFDSVAVAAHSGSCGTAAERRELVIVSDIATDPLWADFTELPLAHGLRACWSIPIFSTSGEVLGTFAMYYREPKSPSPRDLEVLETAAHLAGIAIERKRSLEALRESERRFRFLAEAIPVQVWTAQPDGGLDYVNQRVVEYFDRAAEEMLGERWQAGLHPDDLPKCLERWHASLTTGEPYEMEFRLLRGAEGSYRWHIARALPMRDETGQIVSWFGTNTDIDDRASAEEALRASEARLRLALEAACMDSWDWQIPEGTATRSQTCQTFLACVYPDRSESVREAVSRAFQEGGDYEVEFQTVWPDGSVRWTASKGRVICDRAGVPVRTIGVDMDITDRKLLEEKLRRDACYDALTGLANRALFLERLSDLIARSNPQQCSFAVLFADIDRFKTVNDSLGHLVGDRLLVAIARRLEMCVPLTGTIARLGGDEFAILLENISDISDATQVAELIHHQLSRPFNLNGQDVYTSASIGIALSSENADQIEDLLRDADTAMYRAKALGKARHEIFDARMHAQVVKQLQLETDLRQAVAREEFRLQYQPIVSLSNGLLKGFEALVRWQHPTRGLISPAEFIPIAEETGAIVPMGAWVLRESCRQMHAWQRIFPAVPPLSVSVNLSGKHFSQPNLLLEQIEEILHHSSFNACNLKLEITETVLVEHTECAAALFSKLQEMGIHLYMDDFGTGYSSLSYLHRFPIHTLKIDRSFISRMGVKDENLELVRTIVALAHNLGMDAIAEGVETAEQVAMLRALQCEYAQGYFFSKPLDSEEVMEIMEIYSLCAGKSSPWLEENPPPGFPKKLIYCPLD